MVLNIWHSWTALVRMETTGLQFTMAPMSPKGLSFVRMGYSCLRGGVGSEGDSHLCWLFVCVPFSFFCNINIRARQSSAVGQNMSHIGKAVTFTASWIQNLTILFAILSMTIFFPIQINQ